MYFLNDLFYFIYKKLKIYFFFKDDCINNLVGIYLDFDKSFSEKPDILGSIILKNTINTLFFDIKNIYFRIGDISYFDLLNYNTSDFLYTEISGIGDLADLSFY
jgi:hypothetical protein